jgi:hypothetical protein
MPNILTRLKALGVALSLALAVSLAAASTALADPNDVSIRCEYGSSGYCLELYTDGGHYHYRLYWFSGNEYCIVDEF